MTNGTCPEQLLCTWVARRQTQGGPVGQLTDDDLNAVAQLPEIRTVLPVIGDPLIVRYSKCHREIYVFAASEDMPTTSSLAGLQGRYYTAAEDRDLAPLVILGHKAKEHFLHR